MILEADIRAIFDKLDLVEEEKFYLNYHCRRLAFAVNSIADYKSRYPVKKLLDIGPHFLTKCICEFFPDIEVSTIGWKYERIVSADMYREHIQYDLNDVGVKEIESKEGPFDLITFSETMEHLYTSPLTVLPVLKELLSSDGSIFIQTPNAVTLRARLKLLAGRNPYELIRVERDNPGHFREYTMKELITYAEQTGFKVDSAEFCNYWPLSIPVLKQIENLIPSFRQGISIQIKRQD